MGPKAQGSGTDSPPAHLYILLSHVVLFKRLTDFLVAPPSIWQDECKMGKESSI